MIYFLAAVCGWLLLVKAAERAYTKWFNEQMKKRRYGR